MNAHIVPKDPVDAPQSRFEASVQPWAINHPHLLAVAKAIQSNTIPEMIHYSLTIAMKPREEPWAALRAMGGNV